MTVPPETPQIDIERGETISPIVVSEGKRLQLNDLQQKAWNLVYTLLIRLRDSSTELVVDGRRADINTPNRDAISFFGVLALKEGRSSTVYIVVSCGDTLFVVLMEKYTQDTRKYYLSASAFQDFLGHNIHSGDLYSGKYRCELYFPTSRDGGKVSVRPFCVDLTEDGRFALVPLNEWVSVLHPSYFRGRGRGGEEGGVLIFPSKKVTVDLRVNCALWGLPNVFALGDDWVRGLEKQYGIEIYY